MSYYSIGCRQFPSASGRFAEARLAHSCGQRFPGVKTIPAKIASISLHPDQARQEVNPAFPRYPKAVRNRTSRTNKDPFRHFPTDLLFFL